MTQPRILCIDAFDSFSNNIIALLEKDLQVHVTKVSIHAYDIDLPKLCTEFSGIVLGPGPGTATNSVNVGIFEEIWKLSDEHMLPVLGICLGFQNLVWAFGGEIKSLLYPRHGHSTKVVSQATSIFEGLDSFQTVQYHSLYGTLGHERDKDDLWKPGSMSAELLPLAWDLHPYSFLALSQTSKISSSDIQPQPNEILMAVRHISKPFYGVQFHPESICSSLEAQRVVQNWWRKARAWCENFGRPHTAALEDKTLGPGTAHQNSSLPNGSALDETNPSFPQKLTYDTYCLSGAQGGQETILFLVSCNYYN